VGGVPKRSSEEIDICLVKHILLFRVFRVLDFAGSSCTVGRFEGEPNASRPD
jgi:hypothetical protein